MEIYVIDEVKNFVGYYNSSNQKVWVMFVRASEIRKQILHSIIFPPYFFRPLMNS